jgi:hypothetical protein
MKSIFKTSALGLVALVAVPTLLAVLGNLGDMAGLAAQGRLAEIRDDLPIALLIFHGVFYLCLGAASVWLTWRTGNAVTALIKRSKGRSSILIDGLMRRLCKAKNTCDRG